ncbi:MAG: DUF4157 domain-containing protein, partial [Hyphomicrobium sp.]
AEECSEEVLMSPQRQAELLRGYARAIADESATLVPVQDRGGGPPRSGVQGAFDRFLESLQLEPDGRVSNLPPANATEAELRAWVVQTQGGNAIELGQNERSWANRGYPNVKDGRWVNDVRVVVGPGDNPLAALVLAGDTPAITLGNTIFVDADIYQRYTRGTGDLTATAAGLDLLLHELTHVRQYRDGVLRLVSTVVVQAGQNPLPNRGSYDYQSRNTTYATETTEGQAQMVGNYARFLVDSTFRVRGTSLTDLQRRLAGTGIFGQ